MKKAPAPTKVHKSSILACLDGQPAITRFAPSPTGYLHLGHLVNAIYVWGIARGIGGKVILRMEDHDRTRVRPEYEKAILDDLEWLGLIPDIGLISEFRSGKPISYRQSDMDDRYVSIARDLQQPGLQRQDQVQPDLQQQDRHQPGLKQEDQHQPPLLYACDCSRKTLRQRVTPLPSDESPYDGFCRDRSLPLTKSVAWRLRLPPSETIQFNDLLQGPQAQQPASQCGDVIIRDRNGNWTYQFAVVVDDLRQGVNLIIRGMDILESTGRQLLMAKVIERVKSIWGEGPMADGAQNTPCYLHHGLLMGPNGVKLSKKHFDKDIHQRMLAGENAKDVLGEAAFLAGLIPEVRPVEIEELPGLVIKK